MQMPTIVDIAATVMTLYNLSKQDVLAMTVLLIIDVFKWRSAFAVDQIGGHDGEFASTVRALYLVFLLSGYLGWIGLGGVPVFRDL